MDVAFVGCGAVAERYASGLDAFEGLDLVAVADRRLDRAEALAPPDCPAYGDAADALAEADPDLAVNLTSHGAHAPVTRTCLEAGVGVFGEKPLALDADRARDLVALAERRGLALGCAPINHRCEYQRLAARLLADGRLGTVRLATATANVGRVAEWHDRPDSFLEVGPLYDGAVYPLNLLVEWFGPVERVRTGDAATLVAEADAEAGATPGRPSHVEATLAFEAGPLVRLTASGYAPHRGREFASLEVHGDDGSLYLADAGDLGDGGEPLVRFGRLGREYVGVPRTAPPRKRPYLAGPAALAESIRRGSPSTRSARRAAHVVAICEAIERAAESGSAVEIGEGGPEFERRDPVAPRFAQERDSRFADWDVRSADWDVRSADGTDSAPEGRSAALRLSPIGFGCSRYRDGEYVERADSVAAALDAGYRLLDSAELYGNEGRIGDVLAARGSPDRSSLFLLGKVWNTNHGHVREACERSLSALGTDYFDCYALHWPEAWRYTGPLRDLASLPVEEREAKTFPRGEDGEIETADVPLTDAWRRLESLRAEGLARSLGVCNVDRETLESILSAARVPPAIVQVERHPYLPRDDLVDACHERGIRVIAHSPLSAPGLLEEPVLQEIADERGATPAQAVLAWNVERGVVPIPSSVDPDHVVENAAAAGLRLTDADRERIASLADPEFER